MRFRSNLAISSRKIPTFYTSNSLPRPFPQGKWRQAILQMAYRLRLLKENDYRLYFKQRTASFSLREMTTDYTSNGLPPPFPQAKWIHIRKSFARVSQEFRRSIAEFPRDFRRSSARVSQEFRRSFAKVLHEFRSSFARVLHELCTSFARVLHKFCTSFARVSHYSV